MNIRELQKLDFLLKHLESRADVKKYNISFGLNNQVYTGEFVQNHSNTAVKIKDVTNYNSDVFEYINLKDQVAWSKLFKIHNDLIDPESTDFETVRLRSNTLKSQEYLQLLDVILDKYLICFEDVLPPYIYNVRNLNNKLPISFMKIDKNTEFDFISLMPEDTI
ncbi:hypothetical protein [Staphylococcus equorum]|uniref:hypothetical protein n=1 Tax=Staphylococcus equorum TaxID=246432 RepID=UPI003850900B